MLLYYEWKTQLINYSLKMELLLQIHIFQLYLLKVKIVAMNVKTKFMFLAFFALFDPKTFGFQKMRDLLFPTR